MTPEQLRMARAALQLGVRELAELADVTPNTISRIENGHDAMAPTLEKIRTALENEGVQFISENSGGPGLRLK